MLQLDATGNILNDNMFRMNSSSDYIARSAKVMLHLPLQHGWSSLCQLRNPTGPHKQLHMGSPGLSVSIWLSGPPKLHSHLSSSSQHGAHAV